MARSKNICVVGIQEEKLDSWEVRVRDLYISV